MCSPRTVSLWTPYPWRKLPKMVTLVFVQRRMLDWLQNVVGVALGSSQILKDRRHRRYTSVVTVRGKLLISNISTYSRIWRFHALHRRRDDHIKVQLLRFYILDTAAIKRCKRPETVCFFMAGSWWLTITWGTVQPLNSITRRSQICWALTWGAIAHVDFYIWSKLF